MKLGGTFTGRGNSVLFGIAISTLAGFIFRELALLQLSLLLLLVLIFSASAAFLNIRKLSLSIEASSRAQAGKKLSLKLVLRNHRLFPDSIGVTTVVLLGRDLKVSAVAPWIASGGEAILEQSVVVRHRDCITMVEYKIQSSFPFGLFHIQLKGSQLLQPKVLVYPKKIVPKELMLLGSRGASDRQPSNQVVSQLGEIRGIRQWQPGDASKHIDWIASARSIAVGSQLRVREFDPPGFATAHCHIVFHSFGFVGALLREDSFERALAFLAGSMRYLYSNGIQFTLYADFLAWNPKPGVSRKNLIEIDALLAQSRRAESTQNHELQSIVRSLDQSDTLIILSDIELENWAESLELPSDSVLVDIKQIKFDLKMVYSSQVVPRA